jgi:hypothetical protein
LANNFTTGNFEVLPVLTTGPYDYGETEEEEEEKELTAV